MSRIALFVVGLVGVLSAAPSRADVEVAPPPREIRPDGSRDPAPADQPAGAKNPAETVERIIKNSRAVGDKLARTDTGRETRGTQATILKDIESLLDQQGNPPPDGGGADDKNDQKNQDKNSDEKKNGGDPSGGMKKDSGNEPKNQQAKGGRRPRSGQPKGGQQPKEPGGDPNGGKKPDPMAKGQPMPGGMQEPMPKEQNGGVAGGNPGGKAAKPSIPLDEDVAKEVWGHLPDTLRQQVTQYYKEQFMPRYADLLKQYYSSLANTPQKPGEPRK